MKRMLAISVAALLATSPAAVAQQDGGAGNPSGNPPSAGAGSGAIPGPDTPSARDEAPGRTKESGSSARDEAPGRAKEPGTSARDEAPGQKKDAPDRRSDDRPDKGDRGKDRTNVRDDDKRDGDKTNRDDAQRGDKASRDDNKRDDDKAERSGDRRDGDRDRSGRSDGGTTAVISIPPEKKERVRTVFRNHRVEPVRDVSFIVNVGVSVPRDIRVYPIPRDIVVIVPEYESYRYFIVEEKIVIVDPGTYEIVDIIIIA